jgi:hypothetical protein
VTLFMFSSHVPSPRRDLAGRLLGFAMTWTRARAGRASGIVTVTRTWPEDITQRPASLPVSKDRHGHGVTTELPVRFICREANLLKLILA